MTRVVIDTNELLRMAAGGDRSQLLQSWHNHQFDLLMSLSTLTELRTVLSRANIQKYVPATVGDQFLDLVEASANFVQPDLSAPTCRDPGDSALIATAVGGQANYLISADPDLLDDSQLQAALAERGVHVIPAAQFVHILETGPDTA